MSKNSNAFDDPRAAIRKIMGDNADVLAGNLEEMFSRTIEDLTAAGLDRVKVANAALYVASNYQQKILGTARWIEALRDLADLYERGLLISQKSEHRH